MSEAVGRQALPKARADKLVTEQVGDELLVYDLETDEAHCLSATAALVWRHCDGATTVSTVAESLPDDDATGRLALVEQALAQLRSRRLLDEPSLQSGNGGWSRRQFVVRVGAAGAAATGASLITSISASAQAGCKTQCQVCGTGTNCTASNGSCCSGLLCCPGGVGPSNCRCKCVTVAGACTTGGTCNAQPGC